MSNYTPMAQHERALAFDRLVEESLDLLCTPSVRLALGQTAVSLLEITENAFLPDQVDGLFEVPSSQIRTDNLAIVPMTDAEYEDRTRLIKPITSWANIAWPHGLRKSNFYGIDLHDTTFSEHADAIHDHMEHADTVAQAIIAVHSKHKFPDYEFLASRPIITVRNALADTEEYPDTTLIHEACHALDFRREAPLYNSSLPGSARLRLASELMSYSTEATIHEALRIEPPSNSPMAALEAARREHISSTAYPYTPDNKLMRIVVQIMFRQSGEADT